MEEKLATKVDKTLTPDIGNMGRFTLPVVLGLAFVVWLIMGRK